MRIRSVAIRSDWESAERKRPCQFRMSGVEYGTLYESGARRIDMSFSYEKVKQQLLNERTKLKEQLKRLEAAEYDSIGYGNHMADDATEAFEQAVGVALQRKVEATSEEVERALTKLEDGTYGICEACGVRIDRARLEVLPHARYCLDCQARHER